MICQLKICPPSFWGGQGLGTPTFLESGRPNGRPDSKKVGVPNPLLGFGSDAPAAYELLVRAEVAELKLPTCTHIKK